MEVALSVFINGILGVFAGMAVLYLVMKIIPLIARSSPAKED